MFTSDTGDEGHQMIGNVAQGGSLSALLRAQRSVTAVRVLEDLLANEINIAPGIRTIASESHNSLREFLRSENERDPTFPVALSNRDFLGGSFARHTKISPLDDIDIYFPLNGWTLDYLNNGVRLPYRVEGTADGSRNPVLNPRWTSSSYVDSSKLVAGFAAALQRHFPRTSVALDGHCVLLRMTHGANDDNDGLGYDVVPCFSLIPDATGEMSFFIIPNGAGGWIHTNPKADGEISDSLQTFHNSYYRPAIKLLKYWNVHQLNGVLASYYVELALMYRFSSLRANRQPVTSISEAVAVGFDALAGSAATGDIAHYLPSAPPVRCAALIPSQRAKIYRARDLAKNARLLEVTASGDPSLWWASIFDGTP